MTKIFGGREDESALDADEQVFARHHVTAQASVQRPSHAIGCLPPSIRSTVNTMSRSFSFSCFSPQPSSPPWIPIWERVGLGIAVAGGGH